MIKVQEIAKMIDHSLLHPTMTDHDLEIGCEIADKYQVASVCVKPYAVRLAGELLKDSQVLTGTVVGFPHGNSAIEIKLAETLHACAEGALEIDMVINIGKALQEDWDYLEREIGGITSAAHEQQAIVKVIFENDFLKEDHWKIELCKICTAVGADFVKTSTGYGFVKGPDNTYSYQGATHQDLLLMRKHSGEQVQVKAAGGVRTLDDLLEVRALGVTRVGATATVAIMEAAKTRFSEGSSLDSPWMT